MKKSLSYVLIAALSVSMLVGCGKKESKSGSKTGNKVKVELSEVLANVADSITELEQVSVNINGEIDASAEEGDDSGSVKGTASAQLDIDKNEPSLSGEAKVDVSFEYNGDKLSIKKEAGVYGEPDGDDFSFYFGYDDNWSKVTGDASDITDLVEEIEDTLRQASSAISDIDKEDFEKIEDICKLEDMTEMVGKKECYVISLNADIDTLENLYANLVSVGELDSDEAEKIMDEFKDSFDTFSVKMNYYFDKDSYVPVKFDVDAKIKGEVEDTTFDIKKFKLTATIDTNKADVKSVPSDVEDDAELIEDDFDILGTRGDDDDYTDEEYIKDLKDLENEDDSDDYKFQNVNIDKVPDTVTIGNASVKMGDSFAKLEATGYICNEDDQDLKISADDYDFITMDNPDDTFDYFIVGLQNTSEQEKAYKDCIVYRVNIGHAFSGKASIGKFVLGESTIQDVIKEYPDAGIKEDTEFLYIYDKDQNMVELQFDSETGKISDFVLDIEQR